MDNSRKWSATGVYTHQQTVIECVMYILIHVMFGLVLARTSPNKLICLLAVCFIRCEVETKCILTLMLVDGTCED